MAAVYLALGDSMSIDAYTGVAGGGAVRQFHRSLGPGWTLVDRSLDGCRIAGVPTGERGDLITLTIGGNDLLAELGWLRGVAAPERYRARVSERLQAIAVAHRALLRAIREANPSATFLVGNVYAPASGLPAPLLAILDELNAALAANIADAGAVLADIRGAFRGREPQLLVADIEPNLAGAAEIARLFRDACPRAAGSAAT